MTTRELLELASLDALGLLDEQERDDFERAFRAATPELKAQLRREQTRFADLDRWLPTVEPPDGLRERVLGTVREAITAVSAPSPVIAGRITPAQRWWNAAPVWRAACIGFATASMVLGGFFFYVSEKNEQIADSALNNKLNDFNRMMADGQLNKIINSRNYQRVMFNMVADAGQSKTVVCTATLHFDNETKQAVLVCQNLPDNAGRYALVIEGAANGRAHVLKKFQGGVGDVGAAMELRPEGDIDPLKALERLAIVDLANEGVILRVVKT